MGKDRLLERIRARQKDPRIRRKDGYNIVKVKKTFFRPVARSESQRSDNTSILGPLEVLMVLLVEYQDQSLLFFFLGKASVSDGSLIGIPDSDISLTVIVQQVVKYILQIFNLVFHSKRPLASLFHL